jgi:hypothetical protein
MERRYRFEDAPSSACPHCPAPVEDSLHLFTTCLRVAGAWDYLLHRAILVSGMALANSSLLPGLACETSKTGGCPCPRSGLLLNLGLVDQRQVDPSPPT